MAQSVKLSDPLVLDARLVEPLSARIASVGTAEGRERVGRVLAECPYPHFEAAADAPGLLVRIDADGTRTLGRFVNREFRASGSE